MSLLGVQNFSVTSTAIVTTATTSGDLDTGIKDEGDELRPAKTTPATVATGQVCRTPRHPSTMNTRIERNENRQERRLAARHLREQMVIVRVHPDSAMIGAAIAQTLTGAVLASGDTTAALTGAIPAASIAMEIATGARRTRRGLEQRTNEGDDDGQDPLVVADGADAVAQHLEPGR